jgi:hypothetical protein
MAEVVAIRSAAIHDEAALALPAFLQREEIAAQIVALMQAKFSRPGPEEMLEILRCAEQQVTGLLP